MKLFLNVPRRWLFLVAGIVWTGVGLMLCTRALIWLSQFDVQVEMLIEGGSLLLAIAAYYFGFSKIVQRNMARLHTLPEQVSIFAFTALRGYIMIILMITLGITLRSSPIPKYYLAVPYTIMGGALLLGSLQFYRQFSMVSSRKPC